MLYVEVRNGNIEKALKLLKSKVIKTKQLSKTASIFGILSFVCLITAMIFGMTDTLLKFENGVELAVMQIPAAIGGAIGAPVFHIWAARDLFKRAKLIPKEMKVVTSAAA